MGAYSWPSNRNGMRRAWSGAMQSICSLLARDHIECQLMAMMVKLNRVSRKVKLGFGLMVMRDTVHYHLFYCDKMRWHSYRAFVDAIIPAFKAICVWDRWRFDFSLKSKLDSFVIYFECGLLESGKKSSLRKKTSQCPFICYWVRSICVLVGSSQKNDDASSPPISCICPRPLY